ncbi:MAG: alpha/beta fold hydrolase [Aestuariibacter sp.]
MSTIRVNGAQLFYRSVGEGPETIVFSHGYLMNHTMFNGQIELLSKKYRCISYEHRGHGFSEITQDGYSMDNLVADGIALIEALNLGPVHFVGMSTGGFVAMRIALRRPELLKSIALISTSAEAESPKALKKNKLLMKVVRYLGWWPAISQVQAMMFHTSFLQDENHQQEKQYWKSVLENQNLKAMIAFGNAIFNRQSVLPDLARVSLPVAVVVGQQDVLTPQSCSENMVASLQNATLHAIPEAGHCVAIEKAPEVAQILSNFYRQT